MTAAWVPAARVVILVWTLCLTSPAIAHVGFAVTTLASFDKTGVTVTIWVDRAHLRPGPREDPSIALEILADTTTAYRDGKACRRGTPETGAGTRWTFVGTVRHECGGQADRVAFAASGRLAEGRGRYVRLEEGTARSDHLRWSLAPLILAPPSRAAPPLWIAYTISGGRHILGGLDHLAFLLALLLAARDSPRRAVLLVTVFSFGHAAAIALTASGAVKPSPAIVEPIIVASIAVAAADAWLRLPRGLLVAIAALFGLVHGMGFGRGLLETGLPQARGLEAILAFTFGLEVAQVALVLIALPLLSVAERRLGPLVRYGMASGLTFLGAGWLAVILV